MLGAGDPGLPEIDPARALYLFQDGIQARNHPRAPEVDELLLDDMFGGEQRPHSRLPVLLELHTAVCRRVCFRHAQETVCG